MSTTISLGTRFATELADLALPWQAAGRPDPRLLVLNDALAADLGLDPAWLRTDEGIGLLTGTVVPEGATPVAQAYAGHQFGGYSPRLGDGRALLMGELGRPAHDLHLKGSGRTPFSRGGDGFAAVGPMLREYVVSEAMHALGIPTTRSLAVVATGRPVRREAVLPGAVLARVASSHLRVGTFQYARSTGDTDLLRRLADHAIARHHPHAADAEQPYLAFFESVMQAQASLVAQWMLVGFVHGVMNTDNMTISGRDHRLRAVRLPRRLRPRHRLQLDRRAGPLRLRQPADRRGVEPRPLRRVDPAAARRRRGRGRRDRDRRRCAPSATATPPPGQRGCARSSASRTPTTQDVQPLVADLVALMTADHPDHTGFFRALATAARGDAEPARGMFLDLAGFDAWAERWLALSPDADAMDRVNPAYVPRNHLVEEALSAATDGDLAPVERLLSVLAAPYDVRPGLERYLEPAPDSFAGYQTFCGT